MSYQVLARKWRPGNFAQLVGQDHVVKALSNALDNDRVHHAFLFTGTRGVGKTTIARIFAKALNCERGVSSEPCGECGSCTEIDAGRFVDLIEVDAASRTKVDDTRELLENVQYAPTRGRYKVYLVDEVHMLSTHSFNALLKTLEEPPPHVKFLLATTDPEKLPVTILSRCLQFNLKRLPVPMINEYLGKMLSAEQIPFEDDAVMAIARAADGSMRDGLSILDQAIAYGDGELRTADVDSMLGTVRHQHTEQILKAVVDTDANALWEVVADLADYVPDYAHVLDELARRVHDAAMAQHLSRHQISAASQDMADRCEPEQLQLYYQILLHGKRDLQMSPEPAVGFEMTLLRLMAFSPQTTGTVTQPQGATATAPRTAPRQQMSPAAADDPSPQTASPRAAQTSSARAPVMQPDEISPAEPQAQQMSQPAAGEPLHNGNAVREVPAAVAGADQQSPSAPPASESEWEALIHRLGLKGPAEMMAKHSELKREAEGQYHIILDRQFEYLYLPAAEQKMTDSVRRLFGQHAVVKFSVGETSTETMGERELQQDMQKKQQAVDSMQSDSTVQALKSTFGAELISDSIKPINQSSD